MSIFHRIRKRGIRYALGSRFNQIVPAWLFRFRIFRVYRLAPLSAPAWHDSPSLSYRWCETDDEIATAQSLTYFRSKSSVGWHRLRACVAQHAGAPRDAEMVGGVWQATEYFDEEELGIRFVLSARQAWIFAAFVAQNQRGQQIYPRLLQHVMGSDLSHIHYAAINTTNRASIAAHRHFITAQTGRCVAIRVLSLTYCWTGRGLTKLPRIKTDSSHLPIEIAIQF
jgi:hypothetical protein